MAVHIISHYLDKFFHKAADLCSCQHQNLDCFFVLANSLEDEFVCTV